MKTQLRLQKTIPFLMLGGILFLLATGLMLLFFGGMYLLAFGSIAPDVYQLAVLAGLLFGVFGPLGYYLELPKQASIRIPIYDKAIFIKRLSMLLSLAHYYAQEGQTDDQHIFFPKLPGHWLFTVDRHLMQHFPPAYFTITVSINPRGDEAYLRGPKRRKEYLQMLRRKFL